MSPLAGGRLQPAAAPVAPEKEVTIYIGGVHVSPGPAVIKTLLGSCISVCLFDPIRRVGGMNHFMLPDSELAYEFSEQYQVACS